MTISVEIALDKMNDPQFMSQAEEKPHEATEEVLLPGVVLRVADEDGKIVYDTDKHFASVDRLRENFTDDKLNLAFIAQKFGFSPSYLSRKFKQDTGKKFVEYLMQL